jgi:hypothetical protein
MRRREPFGGVANLSDDEGGIWIMKCHELSLTAKEERTKALHVSESFAEKMKYDRETERERGRLHVYVIRRAHHARKQNVDFVSGFFCVAGTICHFQRVDDQNFECFISDHCDDNDDGGDGDGNDDSE